MTRLTKTHRLIKISEILSTKKHYVTAEVLAKQLGVVERTIYRDLSDLGLLGFAIYNDRGYKLHKTTSLPTLSLTPSDVQTLQLFLNSSPLSQYKDYKKQIDSLIMKLKSLVHTQIDFDSVPIQSADTTPSINKKLKMKNLEKSLIEECTCEVLYHSLEEHEPRWRTLHPYAMAIREGKWYLIAKDTNTKNIHMYRLERIHDYLMTDKTFKRDPNFSLEDYFKDSWSVFRGDKQTIKLRLHDKAIRVFQERNWIKTQKWKQLSHEEVECTITVQGTEEILAWALSMAPNVEIVEPKSLRKKMKIILTETLKKLK